MTTSYIAVQVNNTSVNTYGSSVHWNLYERNTVTQNSLNDGNSASTPWSYSNPGSTPAFNNTVGSLMPASPTSGDAAWVDVAEISDEVSRTNGNDTDRNRIRFHGLTPGNTYFVEFFPTADSTRGAQLSFDGHATVVDSISNTSGNSTETLYGETTADGSGEITAHIKEPSDSNAYISAFRIGTIDTAPSITSVTDSVGSTADRVTSGATVDIALDGAIGTQGSSTVVLEDSTGTYSESGTINNWDETNDIITATFSQSGMRFGDTDNVVRVTLDDATEVTRSGITFRAPTGTSWVNGSSPDTTSDNSVFKDAVQAPSAGYQIIWRDPNSVDPTINSDGTVDSIAQEGDFFVKAWDDSDGTTSSEVTISSDIVITLIGSFNDNLFSALNETGALNDRLFKYLRNRGNTGALNDMIQQEGGWKKILSDLGLE